MEQNLGLAFTFGSVVSDSPEILACLFLPAPPFPNSPLIQEGGGALTGEFHEDHLVQWLY